MDDNDLLQAGALPSDPFEHATPMVPEGDEELLPIGDTFVDAINRARRRREGLEKPIPLPWAELSTQFGGGLWPGVHVLIGSTGSGKTAWALQLALHAAKASIPVGYVGLELEAMQIGLRVLSEAAEPCVPWSRLYTGAATEEELERIEKVRTRLPFLPLYVEFGKPSGWPATELASFARRIRRRHPELDGMGSAPMLLILDFLQIVGEDSESKRMDLRERIGQAAYVARGVARDLNVAVLLISSAARDKYNLLSGALEPGILHREESTQRNVLLNPDALVGLGKESGEIEYAADSVTAALKAPGKENPRRMVFATAKGRATGPAWTLLEFDGYRFRSAPSGSEQELIQLLESRGKTNKRKASNEVTEKDSGTNLWGYDV